MSLFSRDLMVLEWVWGFSLVLDEVRVGVAWVCGHEHMNLFTFFFFACLCSLRSCRCDLIDVIVVSDGL